MAAPDDPSVVPSWTRRTVSNGKKHADDMQLSYAKYEEDEFAIRLTPRAVLPQATLGNGNQSDQFGSKVTGNDIILAPFTYIQSMPSKGVRDRLIDSLNIWLQVPEEPLQIIRNVVHLLHTSSLMFDDIEDNSLLRRSKATTHRVFGVAQTINSSTYVLISSIAEASKLSSKNATSILTDGISNMLRGQGVDLHTTYLAECPNMEEYYKMVDDKTGELFRIAYRLMLTESPVAGLIPSLDRLLILLGRHFQIRDDYMNLVSEEYADQKGYCDDLDEGKYSFPLVHCINSLSTSAGGDCASIKLLLKNTLMSRYYAPDQRLTPELKLQIFEILERSGSLAYTTLVLEHFEQEIYQQMMEIEEVTVENPGLRALVKKLAL